MKPLKYTVAALALIAVASFTSAAKAASNPGDLVLGVYDTNNTGLADYELDLGAFSTLTNGESFNLGTTVASNFSSDSSANLEFDIAAGGGAAGADILSAKEIVFTAASLPGTLPNLNNTPSQDIAGLTLSTSFGAGTSITLPSTTSSTGTSISAVSLASGTTGSFFKEFGTAGYGLGSGDSALLQGAFATGTSVGLYTDVSGSGTATLDGTFSLSDVGGNEILTFDTVATPEPSAYALGLVAVALFFVLKRRSSVA